MDQKAIIVKNLHKTFLRPEERITSFKQWFVRLGRGSKKARQTVLDGVGFEINKGEFVGIVGSNGSGKSTLLKILAGVYTPTAGEVVVNGALTPFIELGVGFNPELSGRDNVFLNGALLGFDRKHMKKMYPDIVAFAELGDHMEKKLKNYSSGMQVRLAFSIAIRANSDILLLDEVLAVGDYAFQQKCFEYFSTLKERKQTVVLVSHDRGAVEKFCDRAILIDGGKVVVDGPPREVYTKYFGSSEQGEEGAAAEAAERPMKDGCAVIQKVAFLDFHGKSKRKFNEDDKVVVVRMEVKALEDLHKPVYGLVIRRRGDTGIVTQTNTRVEGVDSPSTKKGRTLVIDFSLKNVFGEGIYDITALAAEHKPGGDYYDWVEDAGNFTVENRRYNYVPLFLDQKIVFKSLEK